MSKTLSQKKEELEKLCKEVEEQERIESFNKEKADAEKNGLYVPLAVATVNYNLYNRGERDFEEIGDNNWYTVNQLLGSADLTKGTTVALIDIGDYQAWYPVPSDGEYYGIDDDCVGLEDTEENRQYLINIYKQ